MQQLRQLEFDVWIYTTSYRSPLYLKLWFKSFGIRIGGVVNQDIHDRMMRRNRRLIHPPSKYPLAFGIDLHVDDSEGVALEGVQFGFDVLVISPDDLQWSDRVLEAARRLSGDSL